MAAAKAFGQHFLECEHCEENPAQFLCKTCPGHLCEKCKSEHEMRKITKNHEIMHLHRNREETLGLLYCAKHTVNKLEWYCSPCKEPVCTKCLMESHNGHKMEELAKVHNKIRSKLKEEKNQIEKILLPKYAEMLSEEETKKSAIAERTDEVRKQIENHTRSIMEQVTMKKENALQKLLKEEKKAMKSVEETKCEIEGRIEKLLEMNEGITNNLDASPGITFFKKTDSNLLQDLQAFPFTFNYKLGNFQPGFEDVFTRGRPFGNSPEYTLTRETDLQAEGILEPEEEPIWEEDQKQIEIEKNIPTDWEDDLFS